VYSVYSKLLWMEISEHKKETGSDGLICNPSAADLHENGLGIVFRHIGGIFSIGSYTYSIPVYIFVYICMQSNQICTLIKEKI
jgi:hypothetical protein